MEQLLSMGFSDDMAAQALSATGGDSPSKAVDWILSQTPPNDTDTSPQTHKTTSKPIPDPCHGHSSPRPFQPKLDRFFKATDSGSPSSPQNDVASTPPSKRPKLGPPEPQAGPAAGAAPGERVGPAPPPLAERMRPRSLDEVVGQDHLLGSATSPLRAAAERGRLPSLILWGPPGTGKTSLARAILGSSPDPSSFRFVALSAVTAGVRDVRDAAANAKAKARATTVLFVDEVHRFSKAQQDSLLPIIEDGSVVFLGATTENPSFHLTTPLLSRCRVLLLRPLAPHHLAALLRRAARDALRGLSLSVGAPAVDVPEDAVQFISSNCDGDARAALNALEIAATAAAARAAAAANADAAAGAAAVAVSLEDAKEAMQCKHLAYDRDGEEHYNLISALHKSMRGGDGNAGIYWLARMLEGGEEPLYIARRLIRFASEDIGLADPLALNQAVACYQACHFLGMPECNVILAQCVAYLALAPKSVAVYRAIGAAQKAVRDSVGQNEGVPLHLRNAPTKLMKEIGYGKGYIYTPDDPSSFQSFLPPSLEGCKFLNWPESR